MGGQVAALALLVCAAALWCAAKAFDDLTTAVNHVSHQEIRIMTIAQDILDAVTAETTVVDSFITLVTGLIADNTIPAETGTAILAAINAEREKVAAAIAANTPVNP